MRRDRAPALSIALNVSSAPLVKPDGNEVVSTGSSTGTVTITRATCDPTPVLELEVDVTLASEEQTDDGQAKQSLALEGVLR